MRSSYRRVSSEFPATLVLDQDIGPCAMKSHRPLFILKANSSVECMVHSVADLLHTDFEPVVLVETPGRHFGAKQHVLNSWRSSTANVEYMERKIRLLSDCFERSNVRPSVKFVSDASACRLPDLVAKYGADLIVKESVRQTSKHRPRFSSPDEDLIARSPIPVWITGTTTRERGPVLAIGPSHEVSGDRSEKMALVVTTAWDLASALKTTDRVFAVDIKRHDSSTAVGVVNGPLAPQRALDSRSPEQLPQTVSEQIQFPDAASGFSSLHDCIDALDPSTIVVENPSTTTLERCFSSGILPEILARNCNIFFPGPKASTRQAAHRQPPLPAWPAKRLSIC